MVNAIVTLILSCFQFTHEQMIFINITAATKHYICYGNRLHVLLKVAMSFENPKFCELIGLVKDACWSTNQVIIVCFFDIFVHFHQQISVIRICQIVTNNDQQVFLDSDNRASYAWLVLSNKPFALGQTTFGRAES